LESKTNYTIVGLIVLILASALAASILWLSVGFNQKDYNTYAVYMREAVSGLSNESSVKFNGVQVGYVKSIELNHDDPQEVRLLLNIEKGTPITISTSAKLISQGITGTTFVGLSADSADVVLLQKQPGEPYPVIPAKPSLLTQLDKVLTEVSKNINAVSIEVKRIFSKDNAEALKNILANVEKFTDTLSTNRSKLADIVENADTLFKNASVASKKLPSIINKFDSGISNLGKMVNNMATAGKNVSNTMQAGKVAIDSVSQQAMPPTIALINRLNNVANNLEKVSNDMRQNPAVIVRGMTPRKPGPGE
jgi:phospholipid/cholesterol/gamma-HCH transport system substrate-binding protein